MEDDVFIGYCIPFIRNDLQSKKPRKFSCKWSIETSVAGQEEKVLNTNHVLS